MIIHMGTRTLDTERLILRRFTPDDARAMFENWASDTNVTEFLRWPAHMDVSVSRYVVADWVKSYDRNDYYQWAIVPKDFGEPVGFMSVVEQNYKIGMVQIGYAIGKKFWHRGYTSEALAEIIRFFFTEVGVNRIESQHDPNNPHSGGVMKKCGMQYEGTLRQVDFNNKGIVDACMYAIIKEDWETSREIAYYNSLPCIFDSFLDIPELTDGKIRLVCIAKNPAKPEKKYAPSYGFAILKGEEKAGHINLRIGYSGFGPDNSSLYYGGQIGYTIDEKYRGNGL